jgi:signal transduction histidine kinase
MISRGTRRRGPGSFLIVEPDGRTVDVLLVSVSVVTNLGGLAFVASSHDAPVRLSWFGLLLLLAGPLALFRRRSHPASTLVCCVAVAWAYQLSGNPGAPVWLPLIVALVNAVIHGARPAAYSVVVGTLALRLFAGPLPGADGSPLADTARLAGWLALLIAIGEVVRYRRAFAAEKQQRLLMNLETQMEEVRRQAVEQRLTLARDLHDVLGHHLAVINVQAKLGLRIPPDEPSELREVLDVVQSVSHQALQDVQEFLDTLHDKASTPLAPLPTIRNLESLVASARGAGLPIEIEVSGTPRRIPASHDLSAGMVIMEALTNVLRHAGLVPTRIAVGYGPSSLDLTITNPLMTGRTPATVSGGRGISGMHARVNDHGGTLRAGPVDGAQWVVAVRLPLPGERS